MSIANLQASHERAVFLEFIKKSGLNIDPTTVSNRPPREPDIRCTVGTEAVAFELVSLTDPDLAKQVDRQIRRGAQADSVWTMDQGVEALRSKIAKKYETDAPIELLCYSALTPSPDDYARGRIRDAIDAWGMGQFRKVWHLGHDDCALVAAAQGVRHEI